MLHPGIYHLEILEDLVSWILFDFQKHCQDKYGDKFENMFEIW